MADISLWQQIKIASDLHLLVRDGHLMGMLSVPDWHRLGLCNPRMKQAVERGMVHGCASLHELTLALSPQNRQPILSSVAASFPKIRSLVVRGESEPLLPSKLPLWVEIQIASRTQISSLWKHVWHSFSSSHPLLPPTPLTSLCSFTAENVSYGTFVAIEISLHHQFRNHEVAFPSLHTLKVTIHSGESGKSSQLSPSCIEPENLSHHTPQLLCLHWPHLLTPIDTSDLLELAINCDINESAWSPIAKHATSLTSLTLESCYSVRSSLRIDAFPPRLRDIDLMRTVVTIDAPLPPTLVSFRCDILRATDRSYLSARHLPRSLTLLNATSDDSILRDILADLEHVAPNVWAEHHLPRKLHFLGGHPLLDAPLSDVLIKMSRTIQQALKSLSVIYPSVMHFYSHLQLQYMTDVDLRHQYDEVVALAKIQSFIDMQVCKLEAVNEMMKALWALYQRRFDAHEADDDVLIKLLTQCIATGEIKRNDARVDFSEYPTPSFEQESDTSRLNCLRRWQAILPCIWPNIGLKHGVLLRPNFVDAAFLSVFSTLTCITVKCSETMPDQSFLDALRQNRSLHSVFIYCKDASRPVKGAILSVMNHLPKCVGRLSVTLPSERDWDAAFLAQVPASVMRLDIGASDYNMHCGTPYLPSRAATWWPSLVRHVPTSLKNIHIHSSITFCEVSMITLNQWMERRCGANRRNRLLVTYEAGTNDNFSHSFFTFWLPLTLYIGFLVAVLAVALPPTSLFQSTAAILIFACPFSFLLFYRH